MRVERAANEVGGRALEDDPPAADTRTATTPRQGGPAERHGTMCPEVITDGRRTGP